MDYRYLRVDNTGKKFEISKERYTSKDWAFKTMDGLILPCQIYDAVCLSDEIVSIAGHNYYINTLRPMSMDEVDSLHNENDELLMIKDANHKLPDPYNEKLPPFTSAVVMACKNSDKGIALTKDEHQRKLNIIRIICGLVGGDTEITIRKAEELLGYYGLEIHDILREEYVVKNKG